MRECPRARELFGSYWDDEITRAERDWLESHFAACAGCRAGYDRWARALELVGTLPRHEAAPLLAERALEAARRRSSAPDLLPRPARPAWQPLAAAAALVVVAFGAAWMLRGAALDTPVAGIEPEVQQPRLVAAAEPAVTRSDPAPAASVARFTPVATDSLFDHSEDIEFILDPVQLRRGRAHTGSLPEGVQGETVVISF